MVNATALFNLLKASIFVLVNIYLFKDVLDEDKKDSQNPVLSVIVRCIISLGLLVIMLFAFNF